MNALAARRRHPAAIVLLLLLALLGTGTAYAAFAPRPAQAASGSSSADAEEGHKLFIANCATCHGLNAEGKATGQGGKIAGPPLAGVGAAAVDFQMGTGRMPMLMPAVQAPRGEKIQFTDTQIEQIGAYIASLATGPSVPTAADYDYSKGDPARGGEIFSVNCAMCHNSSGAGGALTRGKFAPSLMNVEPKHIYEAMETGPQSMPVFNDANLDTKAKQDVIAFLKSVENDPTPGGLRLGSLGPVSEGLFAWIFGLGLLVGATIWLGKKAA